MTFHYVTILIKPVFNKDKNNYYYNIFLEKVCKQFFKCMFVQYKCYIMTELTFLKELMLIRQANEKSAIFVTIGIF